MQAYDIFMLIVLAAAVAWGAWKGLAWQIASLASLVLSYFVALSFRQPLAQVINASPPWNQFLAMLILFLGSGLIVWVLFNLISEAIERVKLKEFDRQLGALFGAAKGVLLCVLITLFSVALLSDDQRQAICNSRSGYYIAVLLDRAGGAIPPELHEVLGPYIEEFDRNVEHDHVEHGHQPSRLTASEAIGEMFGQSDGQTMENRTQPFFSPAPTTPTTTGRIEAQPATGSFQIRMGGVTPRIIVQPEEERLLGIELER